MLIVESSLRQSFSTVCGEIDGKIAPQTQSGQQKEACPLEDSAQNKLISSRYLSARERVRE
jgi:hypothetical protein